MNGYVNAETEPRWAKNFVRLGRYLQVDFEEGKIKLGEFLILVWLHLKANPHTGKCFISYDGLSIELRKQFSKNQINKIVLTLRRKNYISFEEHRGSRSPFMVTIRQYPRSDITLETLARFEKVNDGRSLKKKNYSRDAEYNQNNIGDWQKLDSSENPPTKGTFDPRPNQNGRTPNNNNEKGIINTVKRDNEDWDDLFPSLEEEKYKEIARWLGEKDVSLTIVRLRNYGFPLSDEAYWIMRKIPESQLKEIHNRGDYFDKLVRNIIEKNNPLPHR